MRDPKYSKGISHSTNPARLIGLAFLSSITPAIAIWDLVSLMLSPKMLQNL